VNQHGGRLEVRQLRASATLASYLREAGWPDAGLVLEVATTVRWPRHPAKGTRHEVRFFLTSLPAQARPADALALVRQHWHIENRLHWPRDVTFGEDACQVRSGRAPQALAGARGRSRAGAMPWWVCSISRGWATWRRPPEPTPGPVPPRCSLSLA
jgi:hypothetical protein